MSGFIDGLKSVGNFLGKVGSAAVQGAAHQNSGNAAQLNANSVSSMAQSATTPTQQEALLRDFAAPGMLEVYNTLAPAQQQAVAGAFAAQLQTPGGAAAALNAQKGLGNLSSETIFLQTSNPVQRDLYAQLPTDQQQMMRANMLLSIYANGGLPSQAQQTAAFPCIDLSQLMRGLVKG